MLERLQAEFRKAAPKVDLCALRYVEEASEWLQVRQDVAEPPQLATTRGAMVTVIDKGGLGYAATSDLSGAGLREAIARAQRYAALTAGRAVVDYSAVEMPRPSGEYRSPTGRDPASLGRGAKYDLLAQEAKQCRIDDRIVDWEANLWSTATHQAYMTADGACAEQRFGFVVPNLSATAYAGG